jgi:hypothetical protein
MSCFYILSLFHPLTLIHFPLLPCVPSPDKTNRSSEKVPTDIARIPDALAVDQDDTPTPQSEVLQEIVGQTLYLPTAEEFFNMPVKHLNLSRLKEIYDRKDQNVIALLSSRHDIHIDDDLRLRMGTGQIRMDTRSSMIDYHLTVGNCLGFSPLLPNLRADHHFCFEMNLKMPIKDFKCKNAMLGFNPAGCMLFLGRCRNEDVYLAMAPNDFLRGHYTPTCAGYSTGPTNMSRRHYRQTVMMLAHFLAEVKELSFLNTDPVYEIDLDSEYPDFEFITDVL